MATHELVDTVCQNLVVQNFDMAVDRMPEASAESYASGSMEPLVSLPLTAGDLYNVSFAEVAVGVVVVVVVVVVDELRRQIWL